MITPQKCDNFLFSLPNEATANCFMDSLEKMRIMFNEIKECYEAQLDDEEAISLETKEQGEYFISFEDFKKLVYDNTQFYIFDFMSNLISSLPKFLKSANSLGFDFQLSNKDYQKCLKEINEQIKINTEKFKYKYKGDEEC